MKIGIIGAGRVGCSIGKYLTDNGNTVTGYYSRTYENAAEAAEFTGTDCFHQMEELVTLSDTLFITTPDGQIGAVWERMKEMSIDGRMICHFSGSLSSDVFTGIDERKAWGLLFIQCSHFAINSHRTDNCITVFLQWKGILMPCGGWRNCSESWAILTA